MTSTPQAGEPIEFELLSLPEAATTTTPLAKKRHKDGAQVDEDIDSGRRSGLMRVRPTIPTEMRRSQSGFRGRLKSRAAHHAILVIVAAQPCFSAAWSGAGRQTPPPDSTDQDSLVQKLVSRPPRPQFSGFQHSDTTRSPQTYQLCGTPRGAGDAPGCCPLSIPFVR